MNIVLFEESDFIDDDIAVVTGRRLEHLLNVNRAEPGMILQCGKLNADMGTGKIVRISENECVFKTALFKDPPSKLPLTLVLALPRPKMFRRLIQTVTCLGVKSIHIINSWRVEKSFWKSPALEAGTIRKQMILGLEQCKDTLMPEINFHRFFREFVEQELPEIGRNTICLTAHPKAEKPCKISRTRPVTLAIGPEGGFIDLEIQSFEKIGFESVHFGPRILKVEDAVTSLISRLFPTII